MRNVRPALALPPRSALALAAALSLGAVVAGEAESPTAPPTGAEETTEEPAQPNPNSTPGDEAAPERDEPQSQERLAAPEIFTPSEEISEDIAVPFPVDI